MKRALIALTIASAALVLLGVYVMTTATTPAGVLAGAITVAVGAVNAIVNAWNLCRDWRWL